VRTGTVYLPALASPWIAYARPPCWIPSAQELRRAQPTLLVCWPQLGRGGASTSCRLPLRMSHRPKGHRFGDLAAALDGFRSGRASPGLDLACNGHSLQPCSWIPATLWSLPGLASMPSEPNLGYATGRWIHCKLDRVTRSRPSGCARPRSMFEVNEWSQRLASAATCFPARYRPTVQATRQRPALVCLQPYWG